MCLYKGIKMIFEKFVFTKLNISQKTLKFLPHCADILNRRSLNKE